MVMVRMGAAVRERRRSQLRRPTLVFGGPFDSVITARLHWTAVARYGRVSSIPEPLTQYEHDPVGFFRDILGVEPWELQRVIAEAVRDHERISVAACYASGKTFIAACIVLWWLYTRRPAMVITTAPTGRQVKTLLFREIRKLHRKARKRLGGRLLQTALWLADDWWAMGFASDAPNSVAGLHEARNVLFIEDEAAGMEAHVVEGFEGITASENSRHLKIGNPIATSGPFFDSHMKPGELERWFRVQINATQTPNYREQRVVVPGLVTYDWVQDKEKRWGRNSPLWLSKVEGKFVVTSGDKFVPEAWVLHAQQQWLKLGGQGMATGERILGVDVAGGGRDETVVYLRQGRVAWRIDAWQLGHTPEQVAKIAKLAQDLGVDKVCIDATGIGKGVADGLIELADKGELCEVIAVQMMMRPEDPDTFAKRVDELNWRLRQAIDPTNPESLIIDPTDADLGHELSVQGWALNEDFKVKGETKRELKKRGIPSPDSKDAVMLTYAAETEVAFVWA